MNSLVINLYVGSQVCQTSKCQLPLPKFPLSVPHGFFQKSLLKRMALSWLQQRSWQCSSAWGSYHKVILGTSVGVGRKWRGLEGLISALDFLMRSEWLSRRAGSECWQPVAVGLLPSLSAATAPLPGGSCLGTPLTQ